ncbi:MAG: hypothetical protein Q9190_002849 [Brigantiaea leucoxantha]
MVNPAPVPSSIPRQPQVPSSASPSLSSPTNGSSNPRIKTEPPAGNHGLPNGIQPNYGDAIARQRAAQQLQERFGSNANLQISQLQAQAAMSNASQHQQAPQNIQLPQLSEQQKRELADRQRQHQYQQFQQGQQRPVIPNAQTDGANDWDDMVAQRRAIAVENPNGTHEADLTLRERVEQMGQIMEGGGLMLPLSERPNHKKLQTNRSQKSSNPRCPQHDGPGDSDDDKNSIKGEADAEDDEDAINSDLDDPDEDIVEEVGEDASKGQLMVCTYDKVQRVKNKWKCVLKDGVLTTGGKE